MPLPIIIDIEASGFGKGSYPIEVGLALPDGQTFCTLIRPEPGWEHWDSDAEAIHGVARPLLASHGRDAGEVADRLNAQLHGQNVYCDGWLQDYSWLGKLYDSVDRIPAFRLKDLRELLSEPEAAIWHATKDAIAAHQEIRRHRASADARLIQETLQQVRLLCHPASAAR